MVAWQIERGAGGCLTFEELKRIVSVLSAFSLNLFTIIQSFLCQICWFGERSWCDHNVLDYMICAVESHKQKIVADMRG